MDTNTMYIEHYVDLHNYINDQFIKLDNNLFTEKGAFNWNDILVPAGLAAGVTVLFAFLGSLIGNPLDKEINALKKFKDNFKSIELSEEQIKSILEKRKYKSMELKEKDLQKLVKELNLIREDDSLFDNIIRHPYEIESSIKTISDLTAICLFFTTSFMKGIIPKGFKDKIFVYIIKFGKEIDNLGLSDQYSLMSILNFIKKHFDLDAFFSILCEKLINNETISAIVKLATAFISSAQYIKHKIKKIDEVKEAVNRYAQEKGLSQELNELLGKEKKNLGEAIESALENMEILLKFVYSYRGFLELSVEIIKMNN